MTVETEISRSGPYAGAGTTGPFLVDFRILDATHLEVIKLTSTGEVRLAYPADYIISGVGGPTCDLFTTAPVPVGQTLTIIRDVPRTQEADYVQNDNFPAETHEEALDKLTMITQQLAEQQDRALTLPASASGSVSTELPAPQGNTLIGWNAAADALQNFDPATLATIVAFGTTNADLFSGTGAQTLFTLSANPGAQANLDVAIGGVTQRPGVDYTWSGGTTLTFLVAPPAGTNNILARYQQGLPQGAADSAATSFLQSGTGAVSRTVQSKLRETKSITDWLPSGYVTDGSVNYATQIQAAINAVSAAGGGTLHFPQGIWNHGTTQLVLKNNITYRGDGYQCTKLLYTGTSDQVVIQNPINASTVANIHIEGLYFQGLSIASRRGNLFDTGSSLLTIERCFFYSSAVGLILDQSELVTVRECYGAGAEAGAWLVNGTDRNPGASTDYTNRIKFDSCQFNGTGAFIGIVDDGGVAHEYTSNNFNAGTNYMRIAAVQGLVITGGEYELATGSGIHFRSTKWNGSAAFASTTAKIAGGYFYNAGATAQVDVGVAGFGSIAVEDCTFNTAGNPFAGFNNCAEVFARGNRQQGAGTGYTGINNYFTGQTYACTWTGATTNPVLNDGTLVANVSRHGRRVTMTVFLTAGPATTFGTGNWMFSLPFVESNIGDTFQVQMTCAGGLYIGVGAIGSPAGRAGSIFTSTSSSAAVQSNIPAAWVASSANTLKFTASYLAANTIG